MNRGNGRGRGQSRPYYSNRNTYRSVSNRSDVSSTSRTSRVASSIGSSRSRVPTRQRPITIQVDDNHGPYKYWKLYFPLEEYDFVSELVPKIKAVEGYIERNLSTFNVEKIEKSSYVSLDLDHLLKDNIFIAEWPAYMNELTEKPEATINCMKLAFNKALNFESKLQIGLMNHQPVLPLSNLKVNYFGKLVTIKGTVIRVGSVGLICTSMAFKCSICHSVEAVVQPQGIFTAPTKCSACKRVAKFDAMETSPYTTTMDWQTAKLQSQGVSGTIPRSVEIELLGELVGSVCPGDLLSVTGIVQVRGESKGGREDGKKAARLLQLYIEAISIHNQRNLSHPSLAFTLNDYHAIREIYASPDVFRLLVHSLCPSIFGHEMVKAGLILGLLGGTDTDVGPRSNPHTLIVGDPGLGKSQLLQAAAHAAPRGIYVCGASASAGGLTVALGREAGGDFALEAGALVLADKGVCCVDELDKMTAHHSSLLEAMEQSTVSVAKGGVVCSLAARATVLAAANPVGGTYNRAKTVAENIKLDSALLSRFDLVFILVDKPDEKMDALLSEHVLALHSGNKSKDNPANKSINMSLVQTLNEEASLRDRLRLKAGEVMDPLPLVLLRKYVAYARRYVHPRLSVDARTELKQFYLEMRRYQQGQGSAPVTARQLEACVRLTQARARANLQEEATVEHARDVICLVKHSLIDTFSDEFGNIQLSRSIHGSGVSSRSKVKKFLEVIRLQAKRLDKDTFSRADLCALHQVSGVGGDAMAMLEALNTHTYLLFKGNNQYKLASL